MGRRVAPVIAGDPALLDIGHGPPEKLLALKADVHPDGGSTIFTCCFTNGPPFPVNVEFQEMAPIFNTIRQASNMMVTRSSWAPDGGNQRLLELCQNALRPADSSVMVDPITADRLFLYQFADHSPIAIRHSVAEIELLRARFWEAIARSLN